MRYAGLLIADRVARFAQIRRARTCSATGLPFFFNYFFFDIRRKKTTFIFAFWQGFRGPDGIN